MPDTVIPSPPVVAFVPREVFSTSKRCLERLIEKTSPPFDLVCVDGNSPEETSRHLREAAEEHGFTVLRSNSYLTPNQARNLAYQWTKDNTSADYIVFIDNDALVSEGWLEAMVECANETGAGVVAPAYYEHLPECSKIHMYGGTCGIGKDQQGRRVYQEIHHLQHSSESELSEPLQRQKTELFEFHAALFRLDVLDELGGFDEGLPCHAEHGDASMLVRKAGYEIWLEPSSKVTYVPPKRLEPADKEYFFLRWSESWTLMNQAHLSRKWNLEHIENDRGRGLSWVRGHRRYGYPFLGRIRKVLGKKLARSFEKRFFSAFEVAANRRRYQNDSFSPLSEIVVDEFSGGSAPT